MIPNKVPMTETTSVSSRQLTLVVFASKGPHTKAPRAAPIGNIAETYGINLPFTNPAIVLLSPKEHKSKTVSIEGWDGFR